MVEPGADGVDTQVTNVKLTPRHRGGRHGTSAAHRHDDGGVGLSTVALAGLSAAGYERRARGARRSRLRTARMLRLRHRNADARPPGVWGPSLHKLPHHRAVLADP